MVYNKQWEGMGNQGKDVPLILMLIEVLVDF